MAPHLQTYTRSLTLSGPRRHLTRPARTGMLAALREMRGTVYYRKPPLDEGLNGKALDVAKKKQTVSGARKALRAVAKSSKRKSVKRPAAATKTSKPKKAPVRRLKKTYMNKKQLDEFRKMLLDKRRTLVGDLSGMEEETARQYSSGGLSSMPTHMADIGTDNFEHEFTLGLLESEQAMLHQIDEAIQRIEDRTYGVCLGTGQRIPIARLRAKPWAKYTVEYARMLEKGLVRPAGDEEEDADQEQGQEQE